LDYEFYTGLHYLVFDLAPCGTTLTPSAAASILTILDGTGKVIAVDDPFDPEQPNKFVPPLPPEGEGPVVLDRPAAGRDVTYSDDALFPVQVRSRAFLQRLKGVGVMPEPFIDINSWTVYQRDTWTPYARQSTPWSTIVGSPGKRRPS